MRPVTTSKTQSMASPAVLYLAFDLGDRRWKLAFTTGLGQRPRVRTIPARDLEQLDHELARARTRFGLREDARVVSCYEAGRDGFWLHRALVARGIANHVVDAASIEVNRRARRAKADRLDAEKLVLMLVRAEHGDPRTWRTVQAPTPEAEDARQLHRELDALVCERTAKRNRIHELLATQGVHLSLTSEGVAALATARCWDGAPLPPALGARLVREWRDVEYLTQRIEAVKALRDGAIASDASPAYQQIRQLMRLRAVGPTIATVLVLEFFSWRAFRNRRQVGGCAGLTPTPFQTGTSLRELGISKAGNRYVRYLAIELAWSWLRWQPQSALSQWYRRRFGEGGPARRRVGIVALARKLLIAMWRYVTTDELPEGTVLKA